MSGIEPENFREVRASDLHVGLYYMVSNGNHGAELLYTGCGQCGDVNHHHFVMEGFLDALCLVPREDGTLTDMSGTLVTVRERVP